MNRSIFLIHLHGRLFIVRKAFVFPILWCHIAIVSCINKFLCTSNKRQFVQLANLSQCWMSALKLKRIFFQTHNKIQKKIIRVKVPRWKSYNLKMKTPCHLNSFSFRRKKTYYFQCVVNKNEKNSTNKIGSPSSTAGVGEPRTSFT